jgi:hypothetical protein
MSVSSCTAEESEISKNAKNILNGRPLDTPRQLTKDMDRVIIEGKSEPKNKPHLPSFLYCTKNNFFRLILGEEGLPRISALIEVVVAEGLVHNLCAVVAPENISYLC